jgi:hypothetical protein
MYIPSNAILLVSQQIIKKEREVQRDNEQKLAWMKALKVLESWVCVEQVKANHELTLRTDASDVRMGEVL